MVRDLDSEREFYDETAGYCHAVQGELHRIERDIAALRVELGKTRDGARLFDLERKRDDAARRLEFLETQRLESGCRMWLASRD
jgi:hypothetical protein